MDRAAKKLNLRLRPLSKLRKGTKGFIVHVTIHVWRETEGSAGRTIGA